MKPSLEQLETRDMPSVVAPIAPAGMETITYDDVAYNFCGGLLGTYVPTPLCPEPQLSGANPAEVGGFNGPNWQNVKPYSDTAQDYSDAYAFIPKDQWLAVQAHIYAMGDGVADANLWPYYAAVQNNVLSANAVLFAQQDAQNQAQTVVYPAPPPGYQVISMQDFINNAPLIPGQGMWRPTPAEPLPLDPLVSMSGILLHSYTQAPGCTSGAPVADGQTVDGNLYWFVPNTDLPSQFVPGVNSALQQPLSLVDANIVAFLMQQDAKKT